MLPAPSHLSVSHLPVTCLRHWYSSRYLQISPLHLEFWLPFSDSSYVVLNAVPGLSPGISHQACLTAYMPFTPNNSEQRLQLTCYRGCWHVISRCLFKLYRHHMTITCHTYSSSSKELYNLSAFIVHAASLRQTFVHCGIFLAAASRRSLGRISVPMCPSTLLGRIPIIALVGLYLTNRLMGREPFLPQSLSSLSLISSDNISRIRYYLLFLVAIPIRRVRHPRVTHQSATLVHCCTAVRLACLRRAASVRSEPGSNSP